MKINGREVTGPNRVTLVLPRQDGDDLVFIAEAVRDLEEIEKYIQPPVAPKKMVKGGTEVDYDNPAYKEELSTYQTKYMAGIILRSLLPSNIEWETVNFENPSTWLNYRKELMETGFSPFEVGRISNLALEANYLDDSKLDAARQVFQRGQAQKEKDASGQHTPQESS